MNTIPSPGRRVVLGVALLAAVVAAGCSTRESESPDEVVIALYRTLALQQVRGAPTPAQLEAITPYLSDELRAALRAARDLHDREQARSPGEKPPYTDGDLFTSLFEGPTSFAIASDEAKDGARRVKVRFTYGGASPPVSWTDEVVVVEQDSRWVVADVVYGGGWDFANKGTLREALSPRG